MSETSFEHDPPPAPLPFDRRRSERVPGHGEASAIRIGGDRFGQIHELRLLNVSGGGLLAESDEPIEPGTVLSIGFSDPSRLARRGFAKRCVPCGRGYSVAIQFQLGLAA